MVSRRAYPLPVTTLTPCQVRTSHQRGGSPFLPCEGAYERFFSSAHLWGKSLPKTEDNQVVVPLDFRYTYH